MDEEIMMNEENSRLAYVVGDGYDMLSNLPCVLTIKQFKIALLEQRLPMYRLWIVGQGLSRDDIQFLRLCEQHLDGVMFCFGSQAIFIPDENTSLAKSICAEYEISSDDIKQEKTFEWRNFHFLDATRVQAELTIAALSEELFFAQDFLFTAARELSERACQTSLPDSVMVIKHANLQSFLRIFPLPIMVETQFTLSHDNKRSLKSLTRFYQDYTCAAEVRISFDLYTQQQAREFYQALAEKTLEHLSVKMEEER
jgi:hypothetical protein